MRSFPLPGPNHPNPPTCLPCLPTSDATTFEGVKTNAYGILASLGPHMETPQRKQLFERLQSRAAASGVAEATSICQLLAGMAQQDTQASVFGGWGGGGLLL